MKINPFSKKNINSNFTRLFKTPNVKNIWLSYRHRYQGWSWYGKVEYSFGDLGGEKAFEHETIEGIMKQINAFLEANQ